MNKLICNSIILVSLLSVGCMAAHGATLQTAATLHRSHLTYLANTERPRELLEYAWSMPLLKPKLDRIVLARAAAQYGLLAAAEGYYSKADTGDDARYTEAWLNIAQGWYKRQRYNKTIEAIQHMDGYMSQEVGSKKGPLKARSLLALGKPAQAADALRQSLDSYEQTGLTRFNLGVALIRSGQVTQGVQILNDIGSMNANSTYEKNLRDKANLTLAYGYLDSAQGSSARAKFKRIRLRGPYANPALLGLGWAQLAPAGDSEKLIYTNAPACSADMALMLTADRADSNGKARQTSCGKLISNARGEQGKKGAGLRNALVAWSELASRQGSDPAIQEALVAIPFAYQTLGDLQQAVNTFETAIDRLAKERHRIRTVLKRIAHETAPSEWQFNGKLGPKWIAQRWNFPAGDHGAYLMRVVTDNGFRLTAKNLRKLYALKENVESSIEAIQANANDDDPQNDTRTDSATARQRKKLTNLRMQLRTLHQELVDQIVAHDRRLRAMTRKGVLDYLHKLEVYLIHARRGRAGLYQHAMSPGGSNS